MSKKRAKPLPGRAKTAASRGGAGLAGYSGTPLTKKLGIKSGHRAALLAAPEGFETLLEGLPEGVALEREPRGKGPFDVIVMFVCEDAELKRRLPKERDRLETAGSLWIGWPKKASGVETDVTEDVVRAAALANGLVDVKVCAIDATWSGLKLVRRLKDR